LRRSPGASGRLLGDNNHHLPILQLGERFHFRRCFALLQILTAGTE
jgi:hypothetical protein